MKRLPENSVGQHKPNVSTKEMSSGIASGLALYCRKGGRSASSYFKDKHCTAPIASPS